MDRHCWRRLAAPLLALVWLAWASGPLHAAGVVGDGTPGSCTDAAFAEKFDGGGLVTFNCGPNPVTIIVTTRVVENGVTATVDGGGKVRLDGEDLRQPFLVLDGGNLTLRHITLQNANSGSGAIFVDQDASAYLLAVTIQDSEADGSDSDGGAVQNRGTLIVDSSRFLRNRADDGGGAINNTGGSVTIRSSVFISNTAFNGGALTNASGSMIVHASLLSGNNASHNGGGLFVTAGNIEVTNVTITNGDAERGGAIYGQNNAVITVLNSTIYNNDAMGAAGGIWNNTGGANANVVLKNTIVAGNNSSGVLNCDGPAMRTLGHNLIGDGTCITALASDLMNTNPLLGSLGAHGGMTANYVPLAGSPAINAGDNSGCPAFDQRGYPRPIGSACDIGSVERGFALWLSYLAAP